MSNGDAIRTNEHGVDFELGSDACSDKESNCVSERLTGSQSLIRSRDDKESNPAAPDGEKHEARTLTFELSRYADSARAKEAQE